ncbi:MAG: hypothetical protein H7124_09685 [Phycisphaerales bacterium]|nr:hypothetical protein [Hyphomonadaceae bacterium]
MSLEHPSEQRRRQAGWDSAAATRAWPAILLTLATIAALSIFARAAMSGGSSFWFLALLVTVGAGLALAGFWYVTRRRAAFSPNVMLIGAAVLAAATCAAPFILNPLATYRSDAFLHASIINSIAATGLPPQALYLDGAAVIYNWVGDFFLHAIEVLTPGDATVFQLWPWIAAGFAIALLVSFRSGARAFGVSAPLAVIGAILFVFGVNLLGAWIMAAKLGVHPPADADWNPSSLGILQAEGFDKRLRSVLSKLLIVNTYPITMIVSLLLLAPAARLINAAFRSRAAMLLAFISYCLLSALLVATNVIVGCAFILGGWFSIVLLALARRYRGVEIKLAPLLIAHLLATALSAPILLLSQVGESHNAIGVPLLPGWRLTVESAGNLTFPPLVAWLLIGLAWRGRESIALLLTPKPIFLIGLAATFMGVSFVNFPDANEYKMGYQVAIPLLLIALLLMQKLPQSAWSSHRMRIAGAFIALSIGMNTAVQVASYAAGEPALGARTLTASREQRDEFISVGRFIRTSTPEDALFREPFSFPAPLVAALGSRRSYASMWDLLPVLGHDPALVSARRAFVDIANAGRWRSAGITFAVIERAELADHPPPAGRVVYQSRSLIVIELASPP